MQTYVGYLQSTLARGLLKSHLYCPQRETVRRQNTGGPHGTPEVSVKAKKLTSLPETISPRILKAYACLSQTLSTSGVN